MTVAQSGNVTPGHMAVWGATGVLQDGGSPIAAQRVIARMTQASFDTTSDQPIILPARLTAFQLTGIVVAHASIPLNVAVGGFYPQSSKAGSPIVSAAQVYAALTNSDLLMQATLTGFASTAYFTRRLLPDWAVYLSLSTPQLLPTLASVYLIGIDLSP